MKIHELRAVEGATKAPKRKGRGTGSGNGKTGGRGHKGQQWYNCRQRYEWSELQIRRRRSSGLRRWPDASVQKTA